MMMNAIPFVIVTVCLLLIACTAGCMQIEPADQQMNLPAAYQDGTEHYHFWSNRLRIDAQGRRILDFSPHCISIRIESFLDADDDSNDPYIGTRLMSLPQDGQDVLEVSINYPINAAMNQEVDVLDNFGFVRLMFLLEVLLYAMPWVKIHALSLDCLFGIRPEQQDLLQQHVIPGRKARCRAQGLRSTARIGQLSVSLKSEHSPIPSLTGWFVDAADSPCASAVDCLSLWVRFSIPGIFAMAKAVVDGLPAIGCLKLINRLDYAGADDGDHGYDDDEESSNRRNIVQLLVALAGCRRARPKRLEIESVDWDSQGSIIEGSSFFLPVYSVLKKDGHYYHVAALGKSSLSGLSKRANKCASKSAVNVMDEESEDANDAMSARYDRFREGSMSADISFDARLKRKAMQLHQTDENGDDDDSSSSSSELIEPISSKKAALEQQQQQQQEEGNQGREQLGQSLASSSVPSASAALSSSSDKGTSARAISAEQQIRSLKDKRDEHRIPPLFRSIRSISTPRICKGDLLFLTKMFPSLDEFEFKWCFHQQDRHWMSRKHGEKFFKGLGQWAQSKGIKLSLCLKFFDSVDLLEADVNHAFLGINTYRSFTEYTPFAAQMSQLLPRNQGVTCIAEWNALCLGYLVHVLLRLGQSLSRVSFLFNCYGEVLLTRGLADFLLQLHRRLPLLKEVSVFFRPDDLSRRLLPKFQVFPKNQANPSEMVSLEEEAWVFFNRLELAMAMEPGMLGKTTTVSYYSGHSDSVIPVVHGPLASMHQDTQVHLKALHQRLPKSRYGLRREVLWDIWEQCLWGEATVATINPTLRVPVYWYVTTAAAAADDAIAE